jgi:Protein of unknown function (DUF2752)
MTGEWSADLTETGGAANMPTSRILGNPGFIPAMVAAMLLAELAIARLLFDANAHIVTFHGTAFGAACAFRARFGIPCPSCGMTRAVVMALHGNLSGAIAMNPAGPVLVFTMLYFSAAMLWLSVRQSLGWRSESTKRLIRWSSIALAAALVGTVYVHWFREVFATIG